MLTSKTISGFIDHPQWRLVPYLRVVGNLDTIKRIYNHRKSLQQWVEQ